jgi:hypothetical protein
LASTIRMVAMTSIITNQAKDWARIFPCDWHAG